MMTGFNLWCSDIPLSITPSNVIKKIIMRVYYLIDYHESHTFHSYFLEFVLSCLVKGDMI